MNAPGINYIHLSYVLTKLVSLINNQQCHKVSLKASVLSATDLTTPLPVTFATGFLPKVQYLRPPVRWAAGGGEWRPPLQRGRPLPQCAAGKQLSTELSAEGGGPWR